MKVAVAGVELAFDVRSPQLVASDLGWDERPIAVLVGERVDREALAPSLEGVAQVVELDGREGDAGVETRASDLDGFLDALEIERPVLVGLGAGAEVVITSARESPGRGGKVAIVAEAARGEELREALRAVSCPVLVASSDGASPVAALARFVRA